MIKQYQQGFTLIELMVVVVMIGIMAAIAMPSYQEYVRRANASRAEQALQNIAVLLEKYKNRNFSYKGFTIDNKLLKIPNGATVSEEKYSIKIQDGENITRTLADSTAMGRSWIAIAESKDNLNYSYLMTNTGVRCRTKKFNEISTTGTSATVSCGANGERW